MTKKEQILQDISDKFSLVRNYLAMPEIEATNRTYILLMFVAYIFSVAIHAYWFHVYGSMEIFRYNGEFIITSPDGWFWGKGVKDAISGAVGVADGFHNAALPKIIAVAKLLLPFVSLETLMFYSPVVVSSLSVIPLVLTGGLFRQPLFGFLSAIFVVALPGFYGRMGFGYFDDDMLTLQFPLWVLFAVLWVAKSHEGEGRDKAWQSVAFLGLVTLMYQWWYPKSFSFLSAMTIMLFLYTLVFARRQFGMYLAVCVMLMGLTSMPLWLRGVGILALACGYELWNVLHIRSKVALLVCVVALFAMLGGFEPIVQPWKMYVFRTVTDGNSGDSLSFYTSIKTVTESMGKPFSALVDEYAGSKELFWLGVFGYCLLAIAHSEFIVVTPFLLIGLLAIDAGNRFVPYANVGLGISLSFLTILFSSILKIKFSNQIRVGISLLAAFFIIQPAINKDKQLQNPSMMTSIEATEYSKLKTLSLKDSLAFGWWDYGFPIAFYSGIKTLTDGGRQGGDLSFVESMALTTPSVKISSNLLKVVAINGSFKETMSKSNIDDPYAFLGILEQLDVKTDKNIFLVLPYRMLQIMSTIEQFSNIDIRNSKPFAPRVFSFTQNFDETPEKIFANNELTVDKYSWVVTDKNNNNIPLVAMVSVDDSGDESKVHITRNPTIGTQTTGLYAIVNTSMRYLVLCDEQMLNSTFMQLFFFGSKENKYYEPVVHSQMLKVFKVK